MSELVEQVQYRSGIVEFAKNSFVTQDNDEETEFQFDMIDEEKLGNRMSMFD